MPYQCRCGRNFDKAQSLNAHYSYCLIHRNGKPSIDKFARSRGWNKGLTKDSDSRVRNQSKKMSLSLEEKYKSGIWKPRGCFAWTQEQKLLWSIAQSKHNIGGKCKWYTIDGKQVQGTWELAFASKMIELGIKWQRPKSFKYNDGIKIRRYTPDFFLPEFNVYVEIKGWFLNEHRNKMILSRDQNNLNLHLLTKELFEKSLKLNKKEFVSFITGTVTQLAEVIVREAM